jgi:hypothetical protein
MARQTAVPEKPVDVDLPDLATLREVSGARRLSITQSEVARVVKGAVAAGLSIGRIIVNPAQGTIAILIGGAADEPLPVTDVGESDAALRARQIIL